MKIVGQEPRKVIPQYVIGTVLLIMLSYLISFGMDTLAVKRDAAGDYQQMEAYANQMGSLLYPLLATLLVLGIFQLFSLVRIVSMTGNAWQLIICKVVLGISCVSIAVGTFLGFSFITHMPS